MFERNNNSVQIDIANYKVVRVSRFGYYQTALVHSSGCHGSTSGNQGQRGYDGIGGDKTKIKKRDVSQIKLQISPGLKVVGNSRDNVSTQLKKNI